MWRTRKFLLIVVPVLLLSIGAGIFALTLERPAQKITEETKKPYKVVTINPKIDFSKMSPNDYEVEVRGNSYLLKDKKNNRLFYNDKLVHEGPGIGSGVISQDGKHYAYEVFPGGIDDDGYSKGEGTIYADGKSVKVGARLGLKSIDMKGQILYFQRTPRLPTSTVVEFDKELLFYGDKQISEAPNGHYYADHENGHTIIGLYKDPDTNYGEYTFTHDGKPVEPFQKEALWFILTDDGLHYGIVSCAERGEGATYDTGNRVGLPTLPGIMGKNCTYMVDGVVKASLPEVSAITRGGYGPQAEIALVDQTNNQYWWQDQTHPIPAELQQPLPQGRVVPITSKNAQHIALTAPDSNKQIRVFLDGKQLDRTFPEGTYFSFGHGEDANTLIAFVIGN